ncbi:uncharacterized protein LOC106160472 [Lingula anatina]|uniref:Uncharacterized protein LOC106160472 n=1 Tax=Lingula anatina TaxID=7574 RepID=A0A1S3I2S8_LINAN|nr:uncharacterized protein LOC106160472 [Lingula anatina]|eukprot:XP_013392548.1 uncharacterized protein LOC106160472 [Lingula anatina]
MSGFNGGLTQTFTLEVTPLSAADVTNATVLRLEDPGYLQTTTNLITGLREGASYTVRLTTETNRPVGVRSRNISTTATTYSRGPFTCDKLKQDGLSSGYYTIQAEGPGGMIQFQVECDMTFDPPLTIVHHDIEGRSSQLGPGQAGYTYRDLTYPTASIYQMTALLNMSGHCHQYRQIECHGLGNPGSGTEHTDRTGVYSYWGAYFPGGSPVSRCLCGKYSACENGRSDCSCTQNDAVWRKDSGYLQEKNILPIVQTRINDIDGGDEMGFETLGPLVCTSWVEGRERPLGMQSNHIPTSSLSASSTHSTCALNGGRVGSSPTWCAGGNSATQWYQIDFGRNMTITKVATVGRSSHTQFVKKYTLLFSDDGSNFECYSKADGTCKKFPGNWDATTTRHNYLRPAARGRSIRFNPLEWNSHVSSSFEVYGYDEGYTNTSQINEGSSVSLSCPTGTWIDILDAFYGVESIGCRADQRASIKAAKNLCQQRTSCTVSSSTGVFGDPCAGPAKYMWITHKCVSILSSCYEYYKYGFRYSGHFEIDPDGANYGVGPFMVECDMTTWPPGRTIIHHSRDDTESSQISGYEACGSWSQDLTYYGIDVANQMAPFVDTVATCSQYAKLRCNGASGVGSCNQAQDRSGTAIAYWAGGNSVNKCSCGIAGTCVDGRTDCNCNKNDHVWRTDEGYFTDKSLLPIKKFLSGDTGDAGESAYYTVGPLECEPALPSCTEWKKFNSTSGLYWVDPDGGGGVAAFEVYCDMSTTPPTVTFHHDYEDRTHVSGFDGAYSYSKSLAYKHYHSIGCWTDTSTRAIATLEGVDSNLDGSYLTRSNPIYKCYLAAKSRGYTYFAVQHGGWCASAATAGDTYDKYGSSDGCNSDGEGGSLASEVYKIYEASVDQVAAYVDYIGSECTQYIKYECYNSVINGYGGWYDRHGQKAPFWGGGDPDGTSTNCACAQDGSCSVSSNRCNCDKNDNVWRSDEGNITESGYLPISMIKFGDTGAGEQGYHTVGPLTCRG